MLEVTCSACGANFKAPPKFAGRTMRCKYCSETILIGEEEVTLSDLLLEEEESQESSSDLEFEIDYFESLTDEGSVPQETSSSRKRSYSRNHNDQKKSFFGGWVFATVAALSLLVVSIGVLVVIVPSFFNIFAGKTEIEEPKGYGEAEGLGVPKVEVEAEGRGVPKVDVPHVDVEPVAKLSPKRENERRKQKKVEEQRRLQVEAFYAERLRAQREENARREFNNKRIEWKKRTLVSLSQAGEMIARYIQLKYISSPAYYPLIESYLSQRLHPIDRSVRSRVQLEYVYEAINKYSSKNLYRNEFYKECEKVLYMTLRP